MIKRAFRPYKKGSESNFGETKKFYQELQDNYKDNLVEHLAVQNGSQFHIYLIGNSAVIARFECLKRSNDEISNHQDFEVTINNNNLDDIFDLRYTLEKKTGWELKKFK